MDLQANFDAGGNALYDGSPPVTKSADEPRAEIPQIICPRYFGNRQAGIGAK